MILYKNKNKSKNIDLTLLTLSYKNLDYLPRFFNNISHVKCGYPVEVLFVDDGTPQAEGIYIKTIKTFSSLLAKSSISKIRLIAKNKNLGIPDSVSEGIQNSSGAYINLKSVDDLYCTSCFPHLELNSEKNFICYPFFYYKQKNKVISYRSPDKSFLNLTAEKQHKALRKAHAVVVGAALIKKEVISDSSFISFIKKFKISTEWPMVLYLTHKGIKLEMSDSNVPLYIYIRNDKSVSNWFYKNSIFMHDTLLLNKTYGANYSNSFLDKIKAKSIQFLKHGRSLKLNSLDEAALLESNFSSKTPPFCDIF